MNKTVIAQSTMSNLVGMWAIVWTDWEQKEIKAVAFIYGKADEKYFIVQAISSLTGRPNTCQLKSIDQMKEWSFVANSEMVDEIRDGIERNGVNKYKASF